MKCKLQVQIIYVLSSLIVQVNRKVYTNFCEPYFCQIHIKNELEMYFSVEIKYLFVVYLQKLVTPPLFITI